MKEITDIWIGWSGPYTLAQIGLKEEYRYSLKNVILNDESKDKGVYQIYGQHPVYGSNVLLYIGKAQDRTFAKRISEEGWEYNEDCNNVQIYVGHIYNDKMSNNNIDLWGKAIDSAERLLIYSHEPARNSSNIRNISRKDKKLKEMENIRVFNVGQYRSLMPEVSGEMWVKDADDTDLFEAE